MPGFHTVEEVDASLRQAVLAIIAAQNKIHELVATIDRLRRSGGELPKADPSSSRSS